ncbi:MAG: CsbD family protein [Pseudomonadota bacterium]
MHWDQIEGNWAEYKNNIKQHWGEITDNQLDMIAGKRDYLAGKIQVMYGISHEEAEHQLVDWQESQINIDGNKHLKTK